MKLADLKELKRRPKGAAPLTDLEILRREAERRGLRLPAGTVRTPEQQAEIAKCKSDPVYFIRHYFYTYDPRVLPKDPFFLMDLWPKQEELIRWFKERLDTQTDGCLEKSRDSGVSYCALAFALWCWLFMPGFSCGFGSYKLEKIDKKDDASSLFVKLRVAMRRLQPWLMPMGWDEAKCAPECRFINPENGSILTGEGGDDVGRGGRTTMYFVDEAAHLEHQELVDRSLSATTSCRIYMSTPNGLDAFYRKRDRMPLFTFHWKDDPRKNKWVLPGGPVARGGDAGSTIPGEVAPSGDSAVPSAQSGHGWDAPEGAYYPWYEHEKTRHDADAIAQEIDISYLGSGNPRFDRAFLLSLLKECPEPLYVEEHPFAATVTTYQEPERGVEYVIVADVAEGLSATGDPDWSVAHVYRTDTWEQVVHYRGRPDTHDYGVDLALLGMQYASGGLPALLCVLRKGPGIAVLEYLMNQHDAGAGYSNLYMYAGLIGGQPQTRPGFPETKSINREAEEELGSILRKMAQGEEGFIWNHPNTIEELVHVVKKPGGKTEAETGFHDDEFAVCRAAAVVLPSVTLRRRLPQEAPAAPRNLYVPNHYARSRR